MNKSLAEEMEKGIASGNLERGKGFCLRACRQSAERVYGTKYDALFRGNGTQRDATAARAGHRFLAAGLAFPASELSKHGGLQLGDMPVKTRVAPNRWGDFSGHIGIVCSGGRIGENSSTRIGRKIGALGYRTFNQWGDFDIVIRLPDPNAQKETPKPAKPTVPEMGLLVANDAAVEMVMRNGRPWVPAREILESTGHEIIKFNDQTQEKNRFYITYKRKPVRKADAPKP